MTDIKKTHENGPETPCPEFAEVKDCLRTVSDVMGEYIYSMRIFPGGQMQWEWGLGAVQEITGYNEMEFRETGGYFPLLHPQDRYDEKHHLEALLKNIPQSMEARLVTRTGETRWVKVLEYPQRDTEQGPVARILVILQDIHSQKSVQQALQESRFQYQNFFENSPFSLWLEDFSEVKKYIDRLKNEGVSDFQEYLKANLEDLGECIRLVKIRDVNTAALKLFKASDKAQLSKITVPEVPSLELPIFQIFYNELVTFARGQTEFFGETEHITIIGEKICTLAHIYIVKGHEDTWDEVLYSAIDITHQKKVEDTLREREARIAAILNALPDIMFICDRQGVFLDYHASNEKMLLLPPEVFLGKHLKDVMPPESSVMFDDYLDKIFQINKIQILEYPIYVPGDVEFYEARGVQYGSDKALIVIRDITSRRKSEEALLRREAILSAVNFTAENLLKGENWALAMPDVLKQLGIATDTERVFIYKLEANTSGEVLPKLSFSWHKAGTLPPLENFLDPNSLDREGILPFQSSLQQGQVVQFHTTQVKGLLLRKLEDQGVHTTLLAPIFIRGIYWGFIGFIDCKHERLWSELEIDALKTASSILGAAIQRQQADEALRKSEERYRILVDVSPDAVVYTALDGKIHFANPRIAMFCHASLQEEIVGLNLIDLIESSQQQQFRDWMSGLPGREGMSEQEYLLACKDGKKIPAGFNVAVVRDEVGKPSGLIWVVRDISERKHMEQKILQSNMELKRTIADLENYNREATLRNEMGNLLESCITMEEAYAVVAQYAEELFDCQPGCLLRLSESRNVLDMAISWGNLSIRNTSFTPDLCWAMRRGRVHMVDAENQRLRCENVLLPDSELPLHYICTPLIAQGNTLGVLHQHILPEKRIDQVEPVFQVFAERIALSLANLKLNETLRMQSVRDPLTNLFNRRYMEETLQREIHRAQRHQRSLGVLMLDLDHFKLFNDTYGHAAGDALLRTFGEYISSHIRAGDIACRYGGDEFTIILLEASLENSFKKAEALRTDLKKLRIEYQNQALDGVSVSIGVTSFPEQGKNAEDILRIADDALYRVKKQGRDRVFLAESKHESNENRS